MVSGDRSIPRLQPGRHGMGVDDLHTIDPFDVQEKSCYRLALNYSKNRKQNRGPDLNPNL